MVPAEDQQGSYRCGLVGPFTARERAATEAYLDRLFNQGPKDAPPAWAIALVVQALSPQIKSPGRLS